MIFLLSNLILHSSKGLHARQRFHRGKTISVQKTRFSTEHRVLAHVTLFSRKNAFKNGESPVFALTNLILHCLPCLFARQRFNRVETVSVQKTRFQHAFTRFRASNAVFAEKRV